MIIWPLNESQGNDTDNLQTIVYSREYIDTDTVFGHHVPFISGLLCATRWLQMRYYTGTICFVSKSILHKLDGIDPLANLP